jgi:hypothetical protein
MADDIADITKPYRPQAIHYLAADTLEYVDRDVAIWSHPVHAALDVLKDVANSEPVGWRIYGWSRILPVPAITEAMVERGARGLVTHSYGAGALVRDIDRARARACLEAALQPGGGECK